MTEHPVSVIVVSRYRPDHLLWCLTGLEQLDYGALEIIVVADPAGIAGVMEAGFAGRIKTVTFDEPNISAARNLGLAQAAGEIVAFIDDDAVPEPSWLKHLMRPFGRQQVAAAGGFVIGRNGISFQHRARRVDALGRHRPIPVTSDAPEVLTSAPGDAVKTEGTNCAVRRVILQDMGGFDPAFHFYLDETDVNLRLAARQATTAIVPLAQVHHGFAASDRRVASRAPTTLFDIGASLAVFLRKHAPDSLKQGLADMRSEQRQRVLRFMVAGQCDPRDIGRLLQTLEQGFESGRIRAFGSYPTFPRSPPPFLRFQARQVFSGMEVLSGTVWQASRLRRQAAHLARQGRRVSLYLFSHTALFHKVAFRPAGFWEQSGGVFGKSQRDDPLFQAVTLRTRVRREIARAQKVRG